MYPNNNQSLDVDYLNQISTKPPRRGFGGIDKRFVAIGGLLLVIIIVAIVAVASNSSRGLPNAETLGARLTGLNSLIERGKGKDITDPTTMQFVAETSLIRQSDRNQLAKIYGNNQSYSKPSAQAIEQESSKSVIDSLDGAAAAGQVNDLYKKALASKIESLVQLLKASLAEANTVDSQQILQKTIADYETILLRYSD